jgi:AraC-like DNA-binding protein
MSEPPSLLDADRASLGQDVVMYTGAEQYRYSLPQLKLDVVRTGVGSGPNEVHSTDGGSFTEASVSIQFPVLGHAHVPHGFVIAVVITAAPRSALWNGVDMEPGMVLLYGPGAHHTAVSPVGLEFVYVARNVRPIEERAQMGRYPEITAARTVAVAHMNDDWKSIAAEMRELGEDAAPDHAPTGASQHVEALIDRLALKYPTATSKRLAKSRLIVAECIAVADHRGARVTIADLMASTAASPRRIRQAFHDAYGLSPMRYLQLRLLSNARDLLSAAGAGCGTVTRVASDLGVTHMGRFSARYRDVYGEPPSETAGKARVA